MKGTLIFLWARMVGSCDGAAGYFVEEKRSLLYDLVALRSWSCQGDLGDDWTKNAAACIKTYKLCI
uniref:Uncharacterized protein n=1 Tax=Rhizophora mucronata TaxID=61149 RepID=A0A2P2JHV3_RHIMU